VKYSAMVFVICDHTYLAMDVSTQTYKTFTSSQVVKPYVNV